MNALMSSRLRSKGVGSVGVGVETGTLGALAVVGVAAAGVGTVSARATAFSRGATQAVSAMGIKKTIQRTRV
jgi:hypothetical protein